MHPFQCDPQPQLQETHRTTHTGATIVAKHIEGTKRPQPHPPHTRGTFHRRLQPLYTEKHKVSCSGFLPKTKPMQHSCSHSNAICNHSFKKRIELRTQEQQLLQNTQKEPNDRSRTRRTHEVPFIADCNHFTRKNTRFRAPASSPQDSPCNQRFKKRIELRRQTQRLVAEHSGGTNHFPSSPLPFNTTSLPHHSPSSPLPSVTTSLHHHFPSSPLPIVTTSHRHHLPSSPPPFLTTPLHHHFPPSPLRFITTSHRHHFPSSPPPIVPTSLPHHSPSSPLPSVTTSLHHHFPSSPLPIVTTSLRHHFSSSPLPIVTTSLRHHPVS